MMFSNLTADDWLVIVALAVPWSLFAIILVVGERRHEQRMEAKRREMD